MAVSLPSDLVLDVMRNADAVRLSAATNKLRSMGDEGSSSEFAQVLDGTEGTSWRQNGPASPLSEGLPAGPRHAAAQEHHVEFERMVLRNLLESLLPQAGSGTFGSGPAAGVWRTLAADQLAGVYAGSGGVGIAEALSSGTSGQAADQGTQWPYFSTAKIEAFVG